jgi:hypothetical protein
MVTLDSRATALLDAMRPSLAMRRDQDPVKLARKARREAAFLHSVKAGVWYARRNYLPRDVPKE